MKKEQKKKQIGKLDYIVLAFLCVLFLTTNLLVQVPLKALPSPIYGGDYYFQAGCINHIRYGGSPVENCNLIGGEPVYFPLYGTIVAGFANLFGLDTVVAMLWFSNIVVLLSVFASYFLFRKIFDDPFLAGTGVAMLLAYVITIIKYTEFAKFVMAPFVILSLYLYYKNQSWRTTLFAGVAGGLGILAHSVFLPVLGLLYLFVVLYVLMGKTMEFSGKEFLKNFKRLWLQLLLIAVLAGGIGLLYWFGPLSSGFVMQEHYLEWNGPGDLSVFSTQLWLAGGFMKSTFFTFSSLTRILFSVFAIVGVILLFFIKKPNDSIRFALLCISGYTLMVFSFIVTVPLLGTHFVPNYIYSVFGVILVLFMLLAIRGITTLIPKSKKNIIPYLLAGLMVLIALLHFQAIHDQKADQWYKQGLTTVDVQFTQLHDFVQKNTDVNDVFLTTKELGFSLNALTGRKLVVSRRAHGGAFSPMDEREMDSAVMLYGNDSVLVDSLLKKWNVKYIYWNAMWLQSEFQVDQSGTVRGLFDPLIAFYSPQWEKYLGENNVSFAVQNTYVDPSLRTERHPVFDIIVISPANYRSLATPWSPVLGSKLEKVWEYKQGSQVISAIYSVKY
ncbi:MAG: hypothetical protein ABIA93_03480 [Candidatus Woesearchaeota archaeon]